MAQESQSKPPAASDSLYAAWFGLLPRLFGSLAAPPEDQRGDEAPHASYPFAASQVDDALKITKDLLENLYGGYFRALIARPPGDEVRAFEALLREAVSGFGDKLRGADEALSSVPDFKTLMPGLAGFAMSSITKALQPATTNVDRAYGGLADAIGLAPLRELHVAAREMALAALAQQRAQAEYLDVAMTAAGEGIEKLIARLGEMGERGESVDTMLALVRLWAATMDDAMHEAMQSPRALQASAELIRAGARSRQHQQRIVAIASEALNVPTRAEMDEAYREIQALKRELRRLRKGAAADCAAFPAPSQRIPTPRVERKKPKGAARA